jgi:hypothetical protein
MFSGCWLCGRWAVDSVETQACKFHRVYQYMISAMIFFFVVPYRARLETLVEDSLV